MNQKSYVQHLTMRLKMKLNNILNESITNDELEKLRTTFDDEIEDEAK